jgi:Ca-activated chloride channel family protein
VKYVFPLDSYSAVAKFEAVFGDQTIRGVIKEKEQAKREYIAAVKAKKQAALMEQGDKPDVFECHVGNLKPNQSCTIRFTYVTEVRIDNGKARFYLPTVIAPAYVPADDLKIPSWPSSSVASLLQEASTTTTSTGAAETRAPLPASVTVPRASGATIPYRLSFTIDVTQPSSIVSLTSPSHKLVVDRKSDARSIVSLAEGSMIMDRDFVMIIEQSSPYTSRAIIERYTDLEGKAGFGGDGLALQVTFCEQVTLNHVVALCGIPTIPLS